MSIKSIQYIDQLYQFNQESPYPILNISVLIVLSCSYPFAKSIQRQTKVIIIIIPVNIVLCDDPKSNNKLVCEHCGGCRCCDPPPDCSLKNKHIVYKMRCIPQYSTYILRIRIIKMFQMVKISGEN